MDPSTIADDQLRASLSCDKHDLYEEMSQRALVSIAASLRELCRQNDAAPQPVEGELLEASGCCCRQEANDADDLLEMGFGLICNADHSLSSGGRLAEEWRAVAGRFIGEYNERMSHRYGGGLERRLIQLRADLDERSDD